MHVRIDAMKVFLTASNCRETVSLFANYTSSNEVSMETVETPLDPPLETTTESSFPGLLGLAVQPGQYNPPLVPFLNVD